MSLAFMRSPARARLFGTTLFLVFLFGSVCLPSFAAERKEEATPEQSRVRIVPPEGPTLGEVGQEPGWSYNTDYIFAVSRALRDSTLPPAGKVPLFVLTIPLDTVLLPFSLLAGLLGQ